MKRAVVAKLAIQFIILLCFVAFGMHTSDMDFDAGLVRECSAAKGAFGPVWVQFRMRGVVRFQTTLIRESFLA